MATIARRTSAAHLPGPPELLPGRPDAIVDLQKADGAALVGATWRYSDADVVEIDFVEVGSEADPLGPGEHPNRTYDIVPHAEPADFDDSRWEILEPEETARRLANGRVCFNWYRLAVTIPERIGGLDPSGATIVFEVVIDDYAEVWVDGTLPLALGEAGGQVVGGFNAPNRVALTTDARPGQRFQLAVFGINGPISASPHNYIWLRSATLDVYTPERTTSEEAPFELVGDGGGLIPDNARLERIAGGFEFTEGPVWTSDGALLFSSPNTNAIYRWQEPGAVSVFRSKSGYTGVDVGRYHQPGSNGLTFDPQGRLTICQHGNRRVIRVNPHGDTTVLADAHEGARLNSPNDLVYRSDGTLFFTDPPFGLADPADAELGFSGVYRVSEDEIALVTDELSGPNGLAFSPDERWLYVGNWDAERKVVLRLDPETGEHDVLVDLTDAPGEDAIDGIKVDLEGNLYVCGPGGIWLLSPDGEHLGTLVLPEVPHNLAWGDADGRALFITAETSVYRIRLNAKGSPCPRT